MLASLQWPRHSLALIRALEQTSGGIPIYQRTFIPAIARRINSEGDCNWLDDSAPCEL
ncbi:Hypothetical protein PMT_2888 [Prochlorococcus marinus str. MIT 9313]|uniref:Uncharacterized protein n=1 Tax=Prochlorococcus marinus (strain MIT 9313) TaxID=74547 RepID=B9ESQ6_PROMM|nr:Hypothetical protein PMT_2888 [Prochlorococcus marinus str. MIT 9313]